MLFNRNGNKRVKKIEGEATFTSDGLTEANFSLPLFRTSVKGKFIIKYRITVEKVNGDAKEAETC